MPESIAGVVIPEPPDLGAWPLAVEYGTARRVEPIVRVTRFKGVNAKLEQRFLVGPGTRRWRVRATLTPSEYASLRDWFEAADGAYAIFDAQLPNALDVLETVKVRFADWILNFEHIAGGLASVDGLELAEVPTGAAPAYTSTATYSRFPAGGLPTALLSADQQIIPLVHIAPPGTTAAADQIWVSDRRVTVNGQLYQPRLLDWGPLTQTIEESIDETPITLGNADGVFTEIARARMLYKARVSISFLHVETGALLQWWAGTLTRYPRPYEFDFSAGVVRFTAADGPAELGLAYPQRRLAPTCWKVFADGIHCPYAPPAVGTGSFTACDKTWTNCEERGMKRFFGGVFIREQLVRVKDNSTGVAGFGRSSFQSSSIVERTVYDRPLQQVFTDVPMPVPCDVLAGRDEGDFYSALAVVGEGVIESFSADLAQHQLDGSPPHDPRRGGGWRYTQGFDPELEAGYAGIGQAPWSGSSAYPNSTYAAGVSLVEIRRSDEKGLQLRTVVDRSVQVTVDRGMAGWKWTAPGTREWSGAITNPFWLAVNTYLKALGLWVDVFHQDGISAASMEAVFDVDSVIASAAIADTLVTDLASGSMVKQFVSRGVLREQKPLRQWLDEILRPALGWWTLRNGKLRVGCRINATPVEAFGEGNVAVEGFSLSGYSPRFNRLRVTYADQELKPAFSQAPPAEYRDEDHALLVGRSGQPEYTDANVTLWGCTTKGGVLRFATVFAREEIGGINEAEWRKHGDFSIRTTILAAAVEAGMVISYTGPETGGQALIGRVRAIRLNSDYTIELSCRTVTASMYQFVTGPEATTPPQVISPVETFNAEAGAAFAGGVDQPNAADPILSERERYIAVSQVYDQGADKLEASLLVRLRAPVSVFVDGARAPEIRTVTPASSGGSMPVGVYYFRVAAYAAGGRMGPPSPAVICRIESGSANRVTLGNINWSGGTWAGYVVYGGSDARAVVEQSRTAGALPSSIVVTDPPTATQTTALPSADYAKVLVRGKGVVHAGINGGPVTQVTAPNRFRVSDFADLAAPFDEFVNETISILADKSDGSAPIWNFQITAYDAATGEFTVSPDCVVAGEPQNSVEVGDLAVVLARATAATANTISCSKFVNASAPSGLSPDAEVGYLVRIIAGPGVGQVRRVIANTGTQLTIARDWDVIPTTTSVFIVEEADWQYETEAAVLGNPQPGTEVELSLSVPNLAKRVILVGAFHANREGAETAEEFANLRMIYFFGEAPSVRTVVANTSVTVYDELILVDSTAGSVTVQLLPAAQRPGRDLSIKHQSGGNACTVQCTSPDTFDDGSSIQSVPLGQTLTITANA